MVIVDGRAFICIALKVTSKRKDDPKHVKLLQWEAAGLSKPSWVDVGKTIKLNEDSFRGKIGVLDQEDIVRIMWKLTGSIQSE